MVLTSPVANIERAEFVRKARARSIRIICLLSAIASTITAIVSLDSTPYFIHHVVLSCIFITGYILNHSGKLNAATKFITIASTLWIVEMCIAFGHETNNNNYLIIALVAITLFYSEGYYRIVSATSIIVLSVSIYAYQQSAPPLFELPAAITFFSYLNVVLPLIIISFICWNVIKEATANQATIQQQKDALEDALQFKDKILSIVGHDMRSPFTSAKSLIDLMDSDLLTEEERRMAFQSLRENIDVSLQTLDNILGWASQGYYGAVLKTKVKREPLNLHSMVEKVKALFSHIAEQKQITLVNDIPPTTFIEADLEQMQFVLRNLTSNALKFSFTGEQVVFRAEEDTDGKTLVSIIDRGVGMTREMVSSLFHINTRFSKEGTTNEKGSGLGLIFCKEFIENNKGEMWLESEPGKGTRVNLRF
jgi:signal transduction histidine kinase